QDAKVVGLAAEHLETGPAIAAAWGDGTVRLWDVGSGTDATLSLGPGIEALRLNPEGTLTVGGPTGSSVVRLDLDLLWPRRRVTNLIFRADWDQLECAAGPAGGIPDLLLAVMDADDAEGVLAPLRTALHDGGRFYSATVAAVPCLLLLAGEEDNRVRW